MLALSGIGCAATMMLLLFTYLGSIYGVVSCLCMTFMGYLGCAVHYHVSIALMYSDAKGRVIGTAVFMATVLQFVLQKSRIEIFISIGLMIGILILLYVVIYPQKDWVFENPLPYEEQPRMTISYGIFPIIASF